MPVIAGFERSGASGGRAAPGLLSIVQDMVIGAETDG
jgi:hypothetical protein